MEYCDWHLAGNGVREKQVPKERGVWQIKKQASIIPLVLLAYFFIFILPFACVYVSLTCRM